MTEHGFIKSINDKLRHLMFVWKIDAASANGTPDCWYSGDKADLWIEYKYGLSHPLSALQRMWLTRRHGEGRHCWVVTGVDDKVSVVTAPPYDQLAEFIDKKQLIDLIRRHCLTE
jgi:hypothetical protein